MKKGKAEIAEGKEIQKASNENCQYLGIFVEYRSKIVIMRKKYFKRTRIFQETMLFSRNPMKGMNTYRFPIVIYPVSFSKWTRRDLR